MENDFLIVPHNRNETIEHFSLKQIAKYLLWAKNCRIIATEVNGFQGEILEGDDDLLKNTGLKYITDCAGIRMSEKKIGDRKSITYSIESKASLSDFKNGFCFGADYNYIIAPKGIIPKELIPKTIGFIEVDLEKFKILKDKKGISFEGIENIKKAFLRKCKDQNMDKRYREFKVEEVSRRATTENLFTFPTLNIIEKNKKESK